MMTNVGNAAQTLPPILKSSCNIDNSHRNPTPPALIALKITSNEFRALFKCGHIATGVHGAQQRPPNKWDVLYPGVLP